MSKMKVVQLFDCQDMPDDIRSKFFDYHGRGNDVTVEHYIYGENEYCTVEEYDKLKLDESTVIGKNIEDGTVYYNVRGEDIISDWLMDNGGKIHTDVYVKHWW